MRRPRSSVLGPALAPALLLALALAPAAQAQNPAPTSAAAQQAQPQPAATTKDPGTRKVLNLPDYGRWNRIVTPTISADGRWVAYAFQPNDGDATLYVKQLDGDKLFTIAVGSAPQFSDDSRWVAYFVSPPERAAGRGGRGGAPPGVPGRGGAAGAGANAQRKFEILDLVSGDKFDVPNAATFKFSKGSRYVAVRTNKAVATDTTHDGTDLVLRELSSGMTRNIGNVNLYDFDDAGRLFAYTVDALGRVGNGVYLVDLQSGETKLLDGRMADFDGLAWSDEGTNLAVLRGGKPSDKLQRANTVLAWMDLGAPKYKVITFDPSQDASFPKDMVLSEFATPRWSKDGSRIFLGIKEQEADRPKSDSAQANVDVWHWKDAEPQSVQIVRIQQERRATYPVAFLTSSIKVVRLGTDAMRNVTYTQNGKWGIGRDDEAYRGEVAWGGSHADYYRVNTETGERSLIARKLVRTMGVSPDSKWFLYLENKHLKATNLETMKTVDLDNGEKISWVDADDDHPYEKPVYGVAGWSKDGKSVLVYGKYDVWQLSLDGTKAVNVTQSVGDAQQIEFRVVRLDRQAGGRGGRGGGGAFGFGGGNEDDEGIDTSKPLLLSAYGEWTKKTGYYSVSSGRAPQPLVYDDRLIGQAQKAQSADRVIFTEQTFAQFPDLWVSTTAFATPRKITDANPQISEYAWGTKKLIDYTNSRGQHLQATLTLPANYEPGKKYPMLVYFYEIMSNTHHQFSMPVYDDRPHISTYASNGYLVLQPDVVYEIGKPGSSAVDCVESAVKKVLDLGYADPKHVGLQGHSWGGYQSSYILTRSDLFAAVVTGAPPTNLVSFYDETYPGTGTLQQGIMELGQVRMGEGATPWTAHDLYEDQSPIWHVREIKTPFMILHGTADNAVDWHQGLEFYGAARRWGKNVILLSYPGEPHHLAKKENQKDFQIRMKQFFDHYLKDAPAPKWMTDGVPQTKKGGPIE